MKLPDSVGEINPQLIRQRNTNNCFGASVEILTGVDQDKVLATLKSTEHSSDFVQEDGRFLQPTAEMLDEVLGELMRVGKVIDPDMFSEAAFDQSREAAQARVDTVLQSLSNTAGVVLWAPKVREGQDPILHAYAVTGYDASEDKIVVADPSEIDGEIAHLDEEAALALATPRADAFVPVYAYGIGPKEG